MTDFVSFVAYVSRASCTRFTTSFIIQLLGNVGVFSTLFLDITFSSHYRSKSVLCFNKHAPRSRGSHVLTVLSTGYNYVPCPCSSCRLALAECGARHACSCSTLVSPTRLTDERFRYKSGLRIELTHLGQLLCFFFCFFLFFSFLFLCVA